jgi:serine/threonine-protein kinase
VAHDDSRKLPGPDVTERTDIIAKVPRLLSGKYKLGRLIGEGGMGAVYEAEHTGLDAKVAVKVLSEGGALDQKALTRFRREARAMGAIRHENVVAVLDTGTDENGVPFLVMELLEGESLAAMLRRERAVVASLAIWIGTQVLSGLTAAHAKGVIHRDLKPGNVFVARQADASHKVKILDFGISKLAQASDSMNVTADGALVGTPNFMAPEQITGQGPIDSRVDIYAVGVLLYRLVTGRLPFVGKGADELYKKILAGAPVPPSKRQPDLPIALEAVILKAMAREREDRYPDAASFRAALQDIARGLPDGELPRLSSAMPIAGKATLAVEADEASEMNTVPAAPASVRRAAERAEPSPSSPSSGSVGSAGSAGTYVVPGRRPIVWLAGALGVLVVGGGTLAAVLMTKEQRPRRPRPAASTTAAATTEDARVAAPPVARPPLRYGIQRYTAHEEVVAAHQPIADYLAGRLTRPVELVVAEDDLALREQLAAGAIDLAALSPYSYVRAKTADPSLTLIAKPVTADGPSYQGYVLARASSAIEKLEQLRGKKFCFVQPGSTSGYLYPRALLRQAGIDPDREIIPAFGQDHRATLRLLEREVCDGAAVYAKILDREGAKAAAFRVLAATDRIPYDAYVVREGLPAAEVEEVRGALLALDPAGAAAAKVFTAKSDIIGFAGAADADYEGVRRLQHLLDAPTPAPR